MVAPAHPCARDIPYILYIVSPTEFENGLSDSTSGRVCNVPRVGTFRRIPCDLAVAPRQYGK
jgi:hypothetical protein